MCRVDAGCMCVLDRLKASVPEVQVPCVILTLIVTFQISTTKMVCFLLSLGTRQKRGRCPVVEVIAPLEIFLGSETSAGWPP